MPTRTRFRSGSSRCAVALAVTLTLSTAVHSITPAACGATVSAEAATRRLNDVRARGLACRSGATAKASPLAWNDRLADAAQTQAREMARLGRMSHRDGQNHGLGERVRAVGYVLGSAVENVAVGYPSLDDVVDAWLDSEGHCENIMNAAVLEFGLACVDAGETTAPEEHRYWALVLAAPLRRR